jgi:hypothetical protein
VALDQAPTVPLAVLIAPVVQSDPRRYSGDWHVAIAEEQRALRERQERAEQEALAERRKNWHGPQWDENRASRIMWHMQESSMD